jgi:hypothetical protein
VPEVDLIGADRAPLARTVTFSGSIKWLENKPFDSTDLAALAAATSLVPGADERTPLLAVSRSGCSAHPAAALGPDELLAGWPGRDRPPDATAHRRRTRSVRARPRGPPHPAA